MAGGGQAIRGKEKQDGLAGVRSRRLAPAKADRIEAARGWARAVQRRLVFRNQVPDDVHFNEPVTHVVKTAGEKPLRNIVIEFKPERGR